MFPDNITMIKGTIFKIQKFSLHDGPGIRITVFLKGCPLSCWWCCNPESMNGVDGSRYGVGNEQEISVDELVLEVEKDRIFYEQSGGGVTFSGGEPLAQPEFLEEVIDRCKDASNKFHVTLDTSGYADKWVFRRISSKVDLVLFDLKLLSYEDHKKYTGVTNFKILDNLGFMESHNIRYWLRLPIIPGITDTEFNLSKAREIIPMLKSCEELDLLPYHSFGENKYEKIGLEYKLKGLAPPSKERMEEIKKYFEDTGTKVRIGG